MFFLLICDEYSHSNTKHRAYMQTRSGSRVKITNANGNEHPILMKLTIRKLGIDENVYKVIGQSQQLQ